VAKKKNILLVVVDCLRADFIYEDKAKIPNIKLLRENGFSLLNTIASTTTTTPSFSSLLTGMYPFENGVRSHSGFSLNKKIKTFPEILKEAGYHTYAEVTGPLGKEVSLDRGFEEYSHRNRKQTIFKEYGDELIEKFKIHYKEPWFTMLHVWTLHHPRRVLPECDNKECGSTQYARSLSSIDRYLGKLLEVVGDDTIIALTGDHGEQIATSSLDRHQKNLRKRAFKLMSKHNLSKKPFSKAVRDTHIGHGHGIYDILVKIPLIFYNEDSVSSGSSSTQVRQIDIIPTLLDLAGVKHPENRSGKSILPIIDGKDKKNRDAFVEAVGMAIPKEEDWVSGIRIDNKYKYIFSPHRKDFEEELYDLESDPEERKNIASKNKELITKFRKRIDDMKTTEMVGEKMQSSDEAQVMERLKDLGYLD